MRCRSSCALFSVDIPSSLSATAALAEEDHVTPDYATPLRRAFHNSMDRFYLLSKPEIFIPTRSKQNGRLRLQRGSSFFAFLLWEKSGELEKSPPSSARAGRSR